MTHVNVSAKGNQVGNILSYNIFFHALKFFPNIREVTFYMITFLMCTVAPLATGETYFDQPVKH